MTEPVETVAIKTLVSEQFPAAPYADTAFLVTSVAAQAHFSGKSISVT